MDASFCYLSRPFPSLENWKVTNRLPCLALYSCKCETVLKQDPWLWKMTAQSRLESPWSQSSHILNNVSVWTVESLNRHRQKLEELQTLDLHIYVYSKILVLFNQVLKPIRELPKTKRLNPKLLLVEPSEFWEKNHAEFEILKLIFSKRRKLSRNSHGETSRYLSLFFCESETWLLRLLDFCKSLSRKNPLKVSSI